MSEIFKPSLDPSSDSQSPLRDFTGELKEYVAEERKFGERTSMIIKFNFVNVVVHESVEPYPFPIASLDIPYSTSSKTRWEAFKDSARKILPQPDIDLLVGKKQRWVWGECTLRGQKDGVWADTTGNAWKVMQVDGFGNPEQTVDSLAELANGKNEQEFYASVLASQELKSQPGYADIVEGVVNRTLLPSLVVAQKVTANSDGTFSKK